jgi:glycosyltransferase involved in cell wall biosynthesis
MGNLPSLTVVVAAFNEEAVLPALHARLAAVLDGLALRTRVLYVDDGSRDGTWAVPAMRRGEPGAPASLGAVAAV